MGSSRILFGKIQVSSGGSPTFDVIYYKDLERFVVSSLEEDDVFQLDQGLIEVTITDDPIALRNLEFTGSECIMWGNDYPHDEGTFPRSEKFREQIRSQVSADEAHAIFAGNAARVYGFDLEALAGARGLTQSCRGKR